MHVRIAAALLSASLAACAAPAADDEAPSPTGDGDASGEGCDTSDLAPGGLEGSVDGSPWQAEGVYDLAGDLQISGTDAAGSLLTVTAFFDQEGRSIAEAMEGGLPATVLLGDGPEDGGTAVWDGADGVYVTRGAGRGELLLAERSDGELKGCVSFTAEGDASSDEIEVRDVRFRLPPFGG